MFITILTAARPNIAAVAHLALQRTSVRKDVVEELRASAASARLDPKNVRVQLVFGEPNAKRQPNLCFGGISDDEVILGTYRTTYESDAGSQPVLIGFILPRSMLPPFQLEGPARDRLIDALVEMLIADLQRDGRLPHA